MKTKLKMKKTFFDENYPLLEKIGKTNFLIKLQSGSTKLRYTPEQFGKGLDRTMKDMLLTSERMLMNSLQMEELQAMSKEDRLEHADWVLKEVDTYVRARMDEEIDLLAELYDY